MSAGRKTTPGGTRSVVVVEGLRTPFVKAGGELGDVHASELGRIPMEELLIRQGVSAAELDEVVFGNVAQPADSANIARVIALRAGAPVSTPASTVHRNCASGMEAITTAFDRIRFGCSDLVLAGGVESMSGIPFLYSRRARDKFIRLGRSRSLPAKLAALCRFRPGDFKPVIGIEKGLTDPFCGLNMGDTAENLAREFAISRQDQDLFALQSHQRACIARAAGILAQEIVPLHAGSRFEAVCDDIGPRKGQSIEALQKLRPYFDRTLGTVTVGNSCPITDGGVALLLASEQKAAELGLEPLGRIVSYAYRGCSPERMGLGPAFSTPLALERAGSSLEDMDRIELNEAFAAQVLANRAAFESRSFAEKELGLSEPIGEISSDRLNVNGGAIALGHPVGASGARIVLTLLKDLRRRGLGRGLATLCVGGGQGGAVVVEAVE
ncbi:MAG: acetyl-CoA C-acyltransferase [Planctomycetota bacterium]|nr:acetyl-CoA C-acyltransferase [Planctomycetota bacterium]